MAIISTADAHRLMKRLQRGSVGYNEANDLHADCYGTIGALVQERDRLRAVVQQLDPDKLMEIENEDHTGNPAKSYRATSF